MNHDHAHGAAQYTDPVCGMKVGADSPHRGQHDGQDYYFCSNGCRTKFEGDPVSYVEKQAVKAANLPGEAHVHSAHCSHEPAGAKTSTVPEVPHAAKASVDTIYTCPMHPQIRQTGPGSCPICGMALEPLMPTAVEDDSELRAVTYLARTLGARM